MQVIPQFEGPRVTMSTDVVGPNTGSSEVREAAVIAGAGADGNELSQLMDEIRASRAEVQQLATRVDKMATSSVHCKVFG